MIISSPSESGIEAAESSEVVLSVRGVSKKFCRGLRRSLFYGLRDIAGELSGTRIQSDRLRRDEFWALKDVNLDLRRGESLGLIGVNGSGKTTLLRLISGLIRPDMGTIDIQGRVAPLIALGAGFNPVLTGRENIYANMSILGLSKQEIDDCFDTVVQFAEIGEAIDSPVQSYSSGMAARLGFACAIHTNPDILLIDEVLVVGDIRFKTKCYQRLHELRQRGTSFIMVSHHASIISTICQRAVYLRKGELMMTGDVVSVMNQYEEDLFLGQSSDTAGKLTLPTRSTEASTGFEVTSIFFRDQTGEPINAPISGEPVYMVLECRVLQPLEAVSLVIEIKEVSGEGQVMIYMNSADDDCYLNLNPGTCEIVIQMPYLGLGLGLYDAKLSIRMQKIRLLDKIESFKFAVKRAKHQSATSSLYQPRAWEVRQSS